MVDFKQQQRKNSTPRCRLNAQCQHTQHLLTTLRLLSTTTTPPRLQSTTRNLTLPQATKPKYYSAPSYITEAPEYYTDAPKYYTTTYAALAYSTDAPKCYSDHSHYTEATAYYTTKAVEYYTKASKYYTATYCSALFVINCLLHRMKSVSNHGVVLLLGVESLMVGSTAGYYTTTTYATTNYYTEALKYFTTKATEYYTATYAALSYYIDPEVIFFPELQHPLAPEYYTTSYAELSSPATPRLPSTTLFSVAYHTNPNYFTEAPAYYTTEVVDYFIKAPKYYTATYAAQGYITKAPEYFIITYRASA
ncbi:hypothetical protein DAPPUDRAFT_247291 [Daphnia pulex]|uniref:Uncharacterized protein n=1 Tax=Daphnia pulex TaxID=6669 RepID=E9GS61_DAPPU|nr:hypothetical protein DAPPUDRAFT_247291 [Daphnia pulex]|eukprot:EFX77724.1 hypothetical protein DAPPUDRAFT_247291 [Daphnia pulex]